MTTTRSVHFEPSGQVRDESGHVIGTANDPDKDQRELHNLALYASHVAAGRYRMTFQEVEQASADQRALLGGEPVVRTLATNSGDLGQKDVQTAGTTLRLLAPMLDAFDGIADLVCPVSLVTKTVGTWLAEDVVQDLALPVAPVFAGNGAPPEINPKLTSAAYDATGELALAAAVPLETTFNSDIDIQALSVRRLANAFKLQREMRVQRLLGTSANWNANNRIAAAVKWNGVTPTPLVDLFAAHGTSFVTATHIAFTEASAQFFFSNTALYQYIAAGGPMPKVLVATMRQVVAGVTSYVWGAANSANAIMVYAPSSAPEVVSTARTLRYIGDAPDKLLAKETNGYLLRSYFDKRRGTHGTRTLALVANDVDLFLSNQLGAIITGIGA